jgi:hypothetical protein
MHVEVHRAHLVLVGVDARPSACIFSNLAKLNAHDGAEGTFSARHPPCIPNTFGWREGSSPQWCWRRCRGCTVWPGAVDGPVHHLERQRDWCQCRTVPQPQTPLLDHRPGCCHRPWCCSSPSAGLQRHGPTTAA